MRRTRVKVCCIATPEEAATAIAAGADALGLVGEMPSGPGTIDDVMARKIARQVPPPIATFLLTSRTRGSDIVDHVQDIGTSTVQIVNHIDPGEYAAIVPGLPGTRLVQVIHVEDDTAIELVEAYEPHVHAFLLDSGRPKAARAELGGTGRAHDWTISRRIVERSGKPVFLAGGLNHRNVGEAIQTVRPFGVDLCSGVRTDGKLDVIKLHAFMQGVF
ncbi:MAG: phosphoribosylanthranilate isomerase [Rhodothermales bacterium]|nr:phosphoribosylanthranilate isomerase [Rhodothermales bacterium]